MGRSLWVIIMHYLYHTHSPNSVKKIVQRGAGIPINCTIPLFPIIVSYPPFVSCIKENRLLRDRDTHYFYHNRSSYPF